MGALSGLGGHRAGWVDAVDDGDLVPYPVREAVWIDAGGFERVGGVLSAEVLARMEGTCRWCLNQA